MLDALHSPELELQSQLGLEWWNEVLTSIDLFCGAGGITAGFELVGFHCVYANDCNPSAIETFKFNHPDTLTDPREVERIDPHSVHRLLRLEKGELSVLTGAQ
jgi:DNA (cytosine-5)-methyltransferase 1